MGAPATILMMPWSFWILGAACHQQILGAPAPTQDWGDRMSRGVARNYFEPHV